MPVIICAPFIGNTAVSLDFSSSAQLPMARASSLNSYVLFSPSSLAFAKPSVLTSQYQSTIMAASAEDPFARGKLPASYSAMSGDYAVNNFARPSKGNLKTFATAVLEIPFARASRK